MYLSFTSTTSTVFPIGPQSIFDFIKLWMCWEWSPTLIKCCTNKPTLCDLPSHQCFRDPEPQIIWAWKRVLENYHNRLVLFLHSSVDIFLDHWQSQDAGLDGLLGRSREISSCLYVCLYVVIYFLYFDYCEFVCFCNGVLFQVFRSLTPRSASVNKVHASYFPLFMLWHIIPPTCS